MALMIFGQAPPFGTVLESVFDLERRLNGPDAVTPDFHLAPWRRYGRIESRTTRCLNDYGS